MYEGDGQDPYAYAGSTVRIFPELASERHLLNLSRADFVTRAAYYHAELNAIHPYREGNGRSLNYFMWLLSLNTKHHLDFNRVNPDEVLHASKASFSGHMGLLETMLDKALGRARR